MDTLVALQQSLMLSVILSMPPVIVAVVIGVIISLIQAVTQIQEQTLPFAFKLIAVGVIVALTGRWMSVELVEYTQRIFDLVPTTGR